MQSSVNHSDDDVVGTRPTRTIPINNLLEILKIISRVEPLGVLLDKVSTTISSAFEIKSLVICTLDDGAGVFGPRAIKGFPQDSVNAIRRHTYTLDRKKQEFRDELRIGERTYYMRPEVEHRLTNDDMDYVVDPSTISKKRASPDEWHPLDSISFLMVDRLGNWIGWIEIDDTIDGKVPPQDVIGRIQLLADLTGIAIENSRVYEDAIAAMNESQGYLDLIVHDIGNIVNPLIYYQEKIEASGALDDKNREYLDRAIAASKAAKGLVDNVRKVSEAKSSDALIKEDMDLREVLVKCISALKRDFPSKDIIIGLDCPENECMIKVDSLIHDLFMNILSNAVKYNPNQTAEVEIGISNGQGVWTVLIEDHGIGIPDEKKNGVFNRFAKRPDGVSGTGMGLSIVSLLVERYNGVISVRDRVPGSPHEGASFEVAFPKNASTNNGKTSGNQLAMTGEYAFDS
ncbi:MAG: HAMP domain-containing histidine kinase [Candidatus Thermoplasmatota archaeon]|nr:HAMP domain-containing histidine kinase [Candidatus Thermoplasmatota archaeon]